MAQSDQPIEPPAPVAAGKSSAGRARARGPYFEIQVHPGDLRRGVKYLFLSKRQAMAWGLGLAAVAGMMIFGLAVFPGVARDLLGFRAYGGFSAQRLAQGQRLEELAAQFTGVADRGATLRRQVEKIHLAYGLEGRSPEGGGGFPFDVPPAHDSIYATTILEVQTLELSLREEMRVVDAFLDEAVAFERANADRVALTPSSGPLRGDRFVLTSPFGSRRNPFTKAVDFHSGLDLAAATGSPIYAPAGGVVTFAGRYPLRQSVAWWRYGNLVAVRHGDDFVTLFGHCDEVRVRAGQRVSQGTVLATVGNTGWSTSPHLHYEIRRRAAGGAFEPVDPRIYILDHRWSDEDQILVRHRAAPDAPFEPLPSILGR